MVGIWVESSGGGSRWASFSRRSNAPWVANYSTALSTRTPSKIRLHVGCGGSPSNWWSNNRSSYYSRSSSTNLSFICREAAGIGTRCGGWPSQALIGMPFTGWWDRHGYANPRSHYSSGNWSTDLYQASGTAVRAKVLVPSGVALGLKVASVRTTCSSAGRSVRIDVYRNGAKIGYVDYGHLANVPSSVYAGASLAQDQQLGVLRFWTPYRAGCWEVRTSSGTHTHFTGFSYPGYGYSCFAAHGAGSYLPAGRWIGTIGPTNATTTKQPCS